MITGAQKMYLTPGTRVELLISVCDGQIEPGCHGTVVRCWPTQAWELPGYRYDVQWDGFHLGSLIMEMLEIRPVD